MALKNETYDIVDIQVNYSKICWSISLMWDSGQTLNLEYLLQSCGTRLFLMWECGHQFVEYRLGERILRKVLDQIHAKMGDRISCILGGLITIEVEMRMTD